LAAEGVECAEEDDEAVEELAGGTSASLRRAPSLPPLPLPSPSLLLLLLLPLPPLLPSRRFELVPRRCELEPWRFELEPRRFELEPLCSALAATSGETESSAVD